MSPVAVFVCIPLEHAEGSSNHWQSLCFVMGIYFTGHSATSNCIGMMSMRVEQQR